MTIREALRKKWREIMTSMTSLMNKKNLIQPKGLPLKEMRPKRKKILLKAAIYRT